MLHNPTQFCAHVTVLSFFKFCFKRHALGSLPKILILVLVAVSARRVPSLLPWAESLPEVVLLLAE
jgi:hypothetical protein